MVAVSAGNTAGVPLLGLVYVATLAANISVNAFNEHSHFRSGLGSSLRLPLQAPRIWQLPPGVFAEGCCFALEVVLS